MTYPIFSQPQRSFSRLIEPLITTTSILGVIASTAFQQVALAAVPLSAAVLINQAKRRQSLQTLANLQSSHAHLQTHTERLSSRLQALEAEQNQPKTLPSNLLTRTHLVPTINQIHDLQQRLKPLELNLQDQKQRDHQIQEKIDALEAKLSTQIEALIGSKPLASIPDPVKVSLPPSQDVAPKADSSQTVALIDAANLYYGAKSENWQIDSTKLVAYLKQHYDCVEIYFYTGVRNNDVELLKSLRQLEKSGCHIIKKDVICRADGSSKANLDIELALDFFKLAGTVGKIMLLSGDGDFIPVVKQAQSLGTKVGVLSFRKSTSKDLIAVANDFRNISTLAPQLKKLF